MGIGNGHYPQARVFIIIFIIIENKYLLRTCFELQIQIKTNYVFLLTGYLPPSDAELDPASGLKT